jgi:hypothetical protein
MKKIVIAFFLFFILSALFMSPYRPEGDLLADNAGGADDRGSWVTTASLSDSIPGQVLESLGLTGVSGIRVNFRGRPAVDYFSYRCDKNKLLLSLSKIPFAISHSAADATYRQLGVDDLLRLRQDIPTSELSGAPGFWTARSEEFDIVECLKPPFRHTLLISKTGNEVLHRIEPFI